MDPKDPSAESAEQQSTVDPAASESEQAPAFDPSTLSPEAKAYLKSQTEAAKFKARESARTAAAEEAVAAERLAMAKKLGLVDDDEQPSPDEINGLLEAADGAAFRANVESQLYRVGSKAGYDIDAMLDSKGFENDLIDALDEIDGITEMAPRSKEFKAAVAEAFAATVEKHPRFKPAEGATRTGPRPDLSQGARGAGPDIDSRIAEAKKAKNWAAVIALKNQKLNKAN